MDIIDQLSSGSFFKGLPREQLKSLSGIVVDRGVEKGQLIFSEGEEGIGFFVVTCGRIKVFKISPDGKEQILHIFGVGEPFGEVPVFEGKSFPASAEALERGRVLFFPREAFIDQIRKNPDFALSMLAILSKRLRVFTRLIEDLSLKEVPARLAAYLLHLRDLRGAGDKLELDISKAQLASILGTIPETLSRILGKLKRRGIIDISGGTISILDTGMLEQLAETGAL